MSILRCDNCDRAIDTDRDADCFVDDPRHSIPPHPDLILCVLVEKVFDWLAEKVPPLFHWLKPVGRWLLALFVVLG
jgi:hypothetical protein